MKKEKHVYSNAFRSLKVDAQARVAVVLLALVPAMVCFYAGLLLSGDHERIPGPAVLSTIVVCTLMIAASGWLILRKYARSVSRLRNYVVDIAAGSIMNSVLLDHSQESDDLQCIEDSLNLILAQMNQQIRLIESKLRIESRLRKALEQQQDDLLKAEQQRVMIQSLGTACHHLGQPATALRMRLYLLRTRAQSMEEMEEIDESFKDLESIESILAKLREVNEYRTVPYISASGASGEDQILAI